MNLCASIDGIFNNLSVPFNKVKAKSASYMAADLVSVGDSWLSFAIKKRLIEPIAGAEDQDWFKCLCHKWKDWKDLWQPELAGRISMVNSPRQVIGSVLKYRGASYNSNDIDSQVAGGKIAVQQNLALLANQVDPGKFNKVLVWRSEIGLCNSGVFQVRLFDSTHYLKAFAIGDVWVAVGWSSDVLPAVKRMSNVAVVVPKSGASCLPFYFDIHIAIPAASRLETKQIGGRVRGPSPLIHQWIEFCLQTARALPFKQEVIPGASPSALESTLVKLPEELLKGKPSLDTNLIAGVLPAEILARWQLGQSITSLGKEASATLNITGCTEMAEVVEVLRETKDECLFEQSCYCSDFEYVQDVVHCSLGYGVTFDFKVALKQRKRFTYPPRNDNGWTNSDHLIDSGSAGNNNSLLTMHSPEYFSRIRYDVV
ncbi:spermidine/putrescine-binding periplasmic protein [Citrus sinensis]|uniref:Spermidine/putrescine-binding periplasmic protein n=1 Tax=Citrus sinensis TaxID=2711 RepID=A0ACB8KH30_CITSI|nr:spermidine/putrescine-binding periplasmic protein [Citrus sinensis]